MNILWISGKLKQDNIDVLYNLITVFLENLTYILDKSIVPFVEIKHHENNNINEIIESWK